MTISILSHTPVWVWGLLLAIVAVGAKQTRTGTATPARAVLLPVATVGLSLHGVLAATRVEPQAALAWVAAALTALALHAAFGTVRGARWRPATRDFAVPGSWLPLAMMLATFATKFHAGVSLALDPSLRGDAVHALRAAR